MWIWRHFMEPLGGEGSIASAIAAMVAVVGVVVLALYAISL